MIYNIDVDIQKIKDLSKKDFLYNILLVEYNKNVNKYSLLKTKLEKRYFLKNIYKSLLLYNKAFDICGINFRKDIINTIKKHKSLVELIKAKDFIIFKWFENNVNKSSDILIKRYKFKDIPGEAKSLKTRLKINKEERDKTSVLVIYLDEKAVMIRTIENKGKENDNILKIPFLSVYYIQEELYVKMFGDFLNIIAKGIAYYKLTSLNKIEINSKEKQELKSITCMLTEETLKKIFEALVRLKFINKKKNDIKDFVKGLKTKELTNNIVILNWAKTKYSFVIFMDELKIYCNGINIDFDYCQGHFLIKDNIPSRKSIIDARNNIKTKIKLEKGLKENLKYYTKIQASIQNLFK